MSYTIERVVEDVSVGEGPHWDAKTQTLYFVDLKSWSIHKYKPSTNEHARATIEPCPSFIIPLEGTSDRFLVSLLRDLVIITWDGISNNVSDIKKIAKLDATEEFNNNRLNDGKVDPTGKLWAGSMNNDSAPPTSDHPATGKLFSFDSNCTLKYHIDKIQISNGLAWSKDSKTFYYIDSLKRTVDQFDYNVEDGSITNRKSIFTFAKHNIGGFPDGQAIDTDGNLWVAVYGGWRVLKINPKVPETLLQTIELPTQNVTSVAFGGRNLDELYVTTGEGEFPTPADGATYRITGLGVKGFEGLPFKLKQPVN